VVNLIDLVAELFAAYGREATEENLRAYVAVLKHAEPAAVQRAVVEACRGGVERLPTAAQLMKAAREIQKHNDEQGQRNKNQHTEIVNKYNQQAIKSGWSLAQRDELIDVCDAAFNHRTNQWKRTPEQLKQEVADLVGAVAKYRQACITADNDGRPRPDEHAERWAWALPKKREVLFDPAKETLWDHIKKLF
jgi:hypothetical protein